MMKRYMYCLMDKYENWRNDFYLASEVEAELAKKDEEIERYRETVLSMTKDYDLLLKMKKKDLINEEIARLRKEIEELKDALSGIREREE